MSRCDDTGVTENISSVLMERVDIQLKFDMKCN
jgi:hypothetical protein